MAMIFIFMMARWYAAKKYYAILEERQKQNRTFMIAVATTVTIFAGQQRNAIKGELEQLAKARTNSETKK